jgi:serine protease inhibitor
MMKKSLVLRTNPGPVEFKADRPFLFYIRETRQNLTLFTGKFLTRTNLSS